MAAECMISIANADRKAGIRHNTRDTSAVFTCQWLQVSSCPPDGLVPPLCSSPEHRRPYGWGAALDRSGTARATGTAVVTAKEWPQGSPLEPESEWSYLWWEEKMQQRVKYKANKKAQTLYILCEWKEEVLYIFKYDGPTEVYWPWSYLHGWDFLWGLTMVLDKRALQQTNFHSDVTFLRSWYMIFH